MKRRTFKVGSQSHLILRHMVKGRSITPMSALRLFKCFRLGGRILDLRQNGHRIKTEIIPVTSGKRVARYSMPAFLRS